MDLVCGFALLYLLSKLKEAAQVRRREARASLASVD